jgi:hypothetical protein
MGTCACRAAHTTTGAGTDPHTPLSPGLERSFRWYSVASELGVGLRYTVRFSVNPIELSAARLPLSTQRPQNRVECVDQLVGIVS